MAAISGTPIASYEAWLINDNPSNPEAPTSPSVLDIIAMMQTLVTVGYTTIATVF